MHSVEGHWIGLDVKDGLDQAVAIIHTDKFVDYPGRPLICGEPPDEETRQAEAAAGLSS